MKKQVKIRLSINVRRKIFPLASYERSKRKEESQPCEGFGEVPKLLSDNLRKAFASETGLAFYATGGQSADDLFL
jgi:hypothetical protein